MKKVEAILTPRAFDAVRELLVTRRRYEIVVSEVSSAQSNNERSCRYRGVAYKSDAPRLKIETVVADGDAMPVAHAIFTASHNQNDPDNTVLVSPLEEVFSIGISKLEEKTSPARPSPIEVNHKLAS